MTLSSQNRVFENFLDFFRRMTLGITQWVKPQFLDFVSMICQYGLRPPWVKASEMLHLTDCRSFKGQVFGTKRGWDPVIDGVRGEHFHHDSFSSEPGFRKY